MKILLSGHRGFIGTYIDMNLDDHEVVGFDLRCGQDIRDKYQIEETFDRHHPDVVIHCAALAGVRRSISHPDDYVKTNLIGTNNLLTIAEKYDVSHFINFSSSSVFGSSGAGSHHEPLREDDYKSPVSMYGITKLGAEYLVGRAAIPTTTIRPFTVYGEHARRDQVLFLWIDALKRGLPIKIFSERGEFPTRGFTYVGDLVSGVLGVLERDTGIQPHATYNLGGDVAISIQELSDMFEKHCETKMIPFQKDILDLPRGDSMGSLANTEKARQELGWIPKQNFKEKVLQILQQEL